MLDKQNFIHLGGREFACQRRNTFADDQSSQAALRFRRDLLSRSQCLKSWSCSTVLRAVR